MRTNAKPHLALMNGRAPAVVYVPVEETSMADAPSRVVAETAMKVELPCRTVTFAVPVSSWDERGDYSVRVHVDRDQDGRVSPGDFFSTMSHLLTHGHGDTVTVPVTRL